MSLAERRERMSRIADAVRWRTTGNDLVMRIPSPGPLLKMAQLYVFHRGYDYPSPNGLISPLRGTNLAYNWFVMNLIAWVDNLGVGDLIDSWAAPFYFRVKPGADAVAGTELSPFQSEYKHIDAWAGEQPQGHRLSMIVEGDYEHNRVELFAPPDDFDESWMNPLPSYAAGQEIAARFNKIDCDIVPGDLCIADMCLVHQTVRDPGCGARVSFDVSFLMKGAPLVPVAATSPSQKGHKARISHSDMRRCGIDWMFLFEDDHSWRIHSLK